MTADSSSSGRGEPETAGRAEVGFKNRLKELVGKQCCGEEPGNVFLLYVTAVFREVGLRVCSSCENREFLTVSSVSAPNRCGTDSLVLRVLVGNMSSLHCH